MLQTSAGYKSFIHQDAVMKHNVRGNQSLQPFKIKLIISRPAPMHSTSGDGTICPNSSPRPTPDRLPPLPHIPILPF
jgi:hypothetical protein